MNGDFTNYASNTTLSFQLDFDQVVGSVIPVSFGNFTLPDVQITLVGRHSFSVQSPQNGFTGTLDLATGAILSNPVTVLLQQISSNEVVSSASIFSLSLTAGTINHGACGQFAGGPLSGTAMNQNTGAATLVAAGCLPSSAPSTLFGLRLAGATPPVPESGTLPLLGSGLAGLPAPREDACGRGLAAPESSRRAGFLLGAMTHSRSPDHYSSETRVTAPRLGRRASTVEVQTSAARCRKLRAAGRKRGSN